MSEQALPTTARAWHLEARPQGRPVPSEFALRDLELPTLGAGQLLVANEYLSVDLARRLPDSELVIYPDAGHGGIFQFHEEFVAKALEFLDTDAGSR